MKNLSLLSLILAASIPLSSFAIEFEAGTSGGYKGTPFTDTVPSDYLQLRSVTICSGSVIDSISVRYEDTNRNIHSYSKHGGNGGRCSTLDFASGEYIVSLSGRYGSKVDSITIKTNYGQTLTKGGGGGPAQFNYTTSDEFQIAGFKGRSGSIIDAIGVIYHRYY